VQIDILQAITRVATISPTHRRKSPYNVSMTDTPLSPPRDVLMELIREKPDRLTRRDIAKALGIKGDDRKENLPRGGRDAGRFGHCCGQD